MSVRVSWTNKAEYSKINIYRSESKIELDSLPEVLTEVAGTATFYVDIQAKVNTVYHYRLGKVSAVDGVERFSENQVFGNFPKTGHGWPKLIRGNWDVGYYGSLTATELFTPEELMSHFMVRLNECRAAASMAALSSPSVVKTTALKWHKFIYDGKIIFIPNTPIELSGYANVGPTWLMLYKMGGVYGTGDAGPIPAGYDIEPVVQDWTISKNNQTYRLRLLSANAREHDGYLPDYGRAIGDYGETLIGDHLCETHLGKYVRSEFINSEYMQLAVPVMHGLKLAEGTKRLFSPGPDEYNYYQGYTIYDGWFGSIMTSTLAKTTDGQLTNYRFTSDDRVAAQYGLGRYGKHVLELTGAGGAGNAIYYPPVAASPWFPVLELILEG